MVSCHQVIITALFIIEMCSVFGFYLRVYQYKLFNCRFIIKLFHDWEKGVSVIATTSGSALS